MMRGRSSAYAVLALALAQLMTPLLPYIGIGRSIGERSDATWTLITPPGWAFAVWGPIYLGLSIFAIWQVLPAQAERAPLPAVRPWAAAALACNAAWPLVYQLWGTSPLSVALILAEVGFWTVALQRMRGLGWRDPAQWFAALPIGAVLGWVLAASLLDVSGWLTTTNLLSASAERWPLPVVVVGELLAALLVLRLRCPWIAPTFVWALIGIGAAANAVLDKTTALAAAMGIVLLLFAAKRAARR